MELCCLFQLWLPNSSSCSAEIPIKNYRTIRNQRWDLQQKGYPCVHPPVMLLVWRHYSDCPLLVVGVCRSVCSPWVHSTYVGHPRDWCDCNTHTRAENFLYLNPGSAISQQSLRRNTFQSGIIGYYKTPQTKIDKSSPNLFNLCLKG